MNSVQKPQLQMLWPLSLTPPEVTLLPDYTLRVFRPGDDTEGYLHVMHAAGFTQFDTNTVAGCLLRVLPDGWFVVEHRPAAQIVATAMASHAPTSLHPFGGELGWVAGSPAHAGKGLGKAVCTAVVRRFLAAGYRRIYLLTDDWRLPALKVYLQLGFVPLLFAPDIAARWRSVCDSLAWPFTPESWPGYDENR